MLPFDSDKMKIAWKFQKGDALIQVNAAFKSYFSTVVICIML